MASVPRRSTRVSKIRFDLQHCAPVDRIYNYTLKTIPHAVNDNFILMLNQFGTHLLTHHISINICKGFKKFITSINGIVPNSFFTSTHYKNDDGMLIPIPMPLFEIAWNMFSTIREYMQPYISEYLSTLIKVRTAIKNNASAVECNEECECDMCQLVNLTMQNLFVAPNTTGANATTDATTNTSNMEVE
jgi:hypothetical protein